MLTCVAFLSIILYFINFYENLDIKGIYVYSQLFSIY